MDDNNDFFDIPNFDYELEKRKFITNMNFLRNMDVETQTLYKKWYEIQQYQDLIPNSGIVKAKIWTPTDINNEELTISEIENLNPVIELVSGETMESDWLNLRIFCHTMEFSQTPGRFLKLLVHDGNYRYLGAVSVSSDVIAITDRDNYIGWTADDRLLTNKRINNSAIGSCIMATQPFGYNFLGGKLTAILITSADVRYYWKSLYNDIMAGITTTSLYGSYSMYNSLKWWHKCGSSTGKMPIKPDDVIYDIWHHWLRENKMDKYEEMMLQKDGVSGPVTGAKQRVISAIFGELGLKSSDYVHGFMRGTYYSCFYENTKEFLCNKIAESELRLKPLFIGDKQSMIDWWKPKAIERYKKLKRENGLKSEILYYNSMIGMSFDEAKEKFFKDVGR